MSCKGLEKKETFLKNYTTNSPLFFQAGKPVRAKITTPAWKRADRPRGRVFFFFTISPITIIQSQIF